MSDSKPHKRPVTREGIALLIEDCERTSAALSLRATPFQLEQASNFLVATVPSALRNLEEQLETQVGLIRDLASELASVSDIAAAPDGDYERWLRELLARADAAVTGSGEPGV